jgi:MraZ protein
LTPMPGGGYCRLRGD